MNPVETVSVQLGARAYDIHIGVGLLSDAQMLAQALTRPQAALVTNTNLWPLYGEKLADTLRAQGIKVCTTALPDGEAEKSQRGLDAVYELLLTNGCDRHTTVIALGGGVIGDLAGFAAATYQRGVPLIQVPTSLLAMVDSSVGGKTAINHALGKNMIGAFHQPACVIADTSTLATLPYREYRSAFSEAIKYGLICDPVFLDWIEAHTGQLLARDTSSLAHLVKRSCEIKADFVARDEFETDPRGIRAHLNLGHTFGHALESALGYGAWLHGEAVACGTVLAASFAESSGLLTREEAARIRRLLAAFGLPVNPPDLTAGTILSYMRRDKKNLEGLIRLVLLDGIGKAVLVNIEPANLLSFLKLHFQPGA
jgi:3-dehydroquinate synthase